LALKMNKGVWTTLFAKLTGEQKSRVEEIMTTVGLVERAHDRAGLLSHGQKQWLEIGMLLAQDPKLLLLDEPVAGMTDEETERTAELFVSLAGQHSLIVVEHDMDFVASIARKVTVLHEGAVIAEGSLQDVKQNERVVEVYLGR
jgi:urea transport system ATP-binding protein